MQDLWDRALDDLRGRLSPESFETWLEPVRYGGLEDDVMILRIPNKFFADWIQSHYLAPMLDANPVATYLGTAVVNPVTIAVFYFTELWIGASLLGLHAPGWEEARAFDAAQWWSVLKELLPAFALGGPLLGLAVSAVSYPLLRWLVQRYQRNQTAGEG